MRPVKPAFGGYTLLIVKPDETVSTREAYAGVRPAVPAASLEESMRLPVTAWQGRVKNDFEPHVFAAHPRLAVLKESLLKAGAVYAAMSGSGSALFGLFDDPVRAQTIPRLSTGYFSTRSGCRGLAAASRFAASAVAKQARCPGGTIYSRPLTGILAMRRS